MMDHTVFSHFTRRPARRDADFNVNIFGARSIPAWEPEHNNYGMLMTGGSALIREDDPTLPHPHSDDYQCWVDVLTSILQSGDTFTMLDLGAGYGRWSVNAALACRHVRQRKAPTARITAVEVDHRRAQLALEHVARNDAANEVMVLVGAVSTDGAYVLYDDSGDITSYGSEVGSGAPVTAFSLRELITGPVDLLTMDVQGAEQTTVPAAMDVLTAHVRRVSIGTHSPEIDTLLLKCFESAGWVVESFLPRCAQYQSPVTDKMFETDDGLISAVNPRLVGNKA